MSKTKKFDLDEIQTAIRKFVKERDWDQFHTPKNLSMALTGEVGELVEIFQWLTEEQAGRVMDKSEKALAVRNELADVLFYLLRIADVLKVDMGEAFWEKFEQNSKKYPVELSKGHAKKYTEL